MSSSSQGGLPPSLQRKLTKLQDHAHTDIWQHDPLTSLSTTNTPATRRNVRTLIERALVASHEEYLRDTDSIILAVEETQATLDALQSLCERMQHIVSVQDRSFTRVMDEIHALERGIQLTEARKGWLEEYEAKYQLPSETAQVVQHGVIDDAFFDALNRIQAVYANCRSLGGAGGGSSGGLKLVEQLSGLLDEAFRHVCTWIQSECQRIERPEDAQSLEITELMPKAMKCLRARPPLYSFCAEEIAIARKTAVFQKFIQALSQGSRPIEGHRGDPWRYANDMLAWIHASIAGEMELVGVMFEGCYSSRSRGGVHEVTRTESYDVVDGSHDEVGGGTSRVGQQHTTLQEIMDTIFEGVCRPLKLRLDQILLGAPSPVLNFQLITLFSFYMKTVAPVMGHGSNLFRTLRGCRVSAEKALKDQMRQRGERLVRQVVVPGLELGWVSGAVGEGWDERLGVAVSIVKFYDGSFLAGADGGTNGADDGDDGGDGDDGDDGREDNFEDNANVDVDVLLEAIIAPLVDAILASSEALNPTSSVRLDDRGGSMDPSNQHVFILNCLCHIQNRIGLYDSAAALCERLAARIDDTVATLVILQTTRVLQGTGLEAGRIDELDGVQTAAAAAFALWTKVRGDDRATGGATDLLVDAKLKDRIREEVATNVTDAYVRAYHRCAMDEELCKKLGRPEEVRSFLL